MIGAARLGGGRVGCPQAKPGRSDGLRYPVALICCRDGAHVRRHLRGSTGETRRARSGQDKDPAAVGHSVQTPRTSPVNAQDPGHDGGAKLRSRQRDTRTNVRALLRRRSLFEIPGGGNVVRCISVPWRDRVPLSCSAKDLARAKSKASHSPPQGGERVLMHDLSEPLPPCGGERNFLGLAQLSPWKFQERGAGCLSQRGRPSRGPRPTVRPPRRSALPRVRQ